MIITVKHNFETAHRLPFLEGKCENIHGHSWWVEWLFQDHMDENGLTLEYGALKKKLRGWVDENLDHGIMLGYQDRLLLPILQDQCKVFIFGGDGYPWQPWPTVEAVAEMLSHVPAKVGLGVGPIEVRVQETHVNAAVWRYDESQ